MKEYRLLLGGPRNGPRGKKANKPVVDFLSIGSAAQSMFEKADKVRGPREKWIPWCKVFLMYLRTCLVAWVVVNFICFI